MSEFDSNNGGGRRPPRIADLATEPDAARWALDCGWVPGSGHCRNRLCSPECPFSDQRATEASRIEHTRRERRRDQRAFAERMMRLKSH